MSSIERFPIFGKEFSMSSDVRQYYAVTSLFDEMRESLLLKFLEYNKSFTLEGTSGVTDVTPVAESLNTQYSMCAKRVADMLCKQDIWCYNAELLVEKNKGYAQLQEISEIVSRKTGEILIRGLEQFMDSLQNAQRSAYSSVVGTGTRVYTSSPATLLLFSAYEDSVIRNQVDKADAAYQRMVSSMATSNAGETDRNLNRMLANDWYPAIRDNIDMYIYELMDTYLKALAENGKFDLSIIGTINIRKCNAIIENLEKCDNKREALFQAICICPYNYEVYRCIADNELLDEDVIHVAHLFGLDQRIIKYAQEKYTRIINNEKTVSGRYKKAVDFAPALSRISGLDEKTIIRREMEDCFISSMTVPYERVRRLLADNKLIDKWCREKLGKDIVTILSLPEDRVKSICSEYVRQIANKEDVELFDQIGFHSGIMRCLPNAAFFTIDSSVFEVICEQWSSRLFNAVSDYCTEARRRKSVVEQKKKECDSMIANQHVMIQSMKNELSNLGSLAFGKKNSLKQRIADAEAEMLSFPRTSGLQSAEQCFADMYMR